MAKVSLGSFEGTTTANANMVEIFRQDEITANPNCHLKYAHHMVLRAITINAPDGTEVEINGAGVTIGSSGRYEIEIGQVDVISLVFESAISVSIQYMY